MNNKYSVTYIARTYKYTIWGKWQNLTVHEQKNAKILLANLLGVTWHTIDKWMYYRKEDNKTIPADKLYQLSTFFQCEISEMWNTMPRCLSSEFDKLRKQSKL